MKIKIGNGAFKMTPVRAPYWDNNLTIFLDRVRSRVSQDWFCGGRPSVPNPLKTTIESETNILIFSPLDKGKSAVDINYTPSPNQVREMGYVAKKFLKRAKLRDTSEINKAVQDSFGTYSFPIPWDRILDKFGKDHSILVTTVVDYHVFKLPQVDYILASMYICVPYRASHYVRRFEKCLEDGTRQHIDAFFWDFTLYGAPVEPKTDTARRVRKEANTQKRKNAARKLKALKEALKELEKEQKLLKKE